MSLIAVEITGDDRKATQAFARLQSKVAELEDKLRKAGRAGQGMSGGLEKAITSAARMVAGYFSISQAINIVSRSMETFNQNMREAVSNSDRMIEAFRPVLASEPGPAGRERMMQLQAIAKEKGVGAEETAKLFDDLADAMGGDNEGAMRELREVLDVRKMGMDAASLTDIATRAGGFPGADVGQVSRQAFLAGERFRVSPELLSKTFGQAELFGSSAEGMAVAAMLSGKMTGRKAVGAFDTLIDVLGPGADKDVTRRMARMGITADMSIMAKLEKFADLGIDTMAEFMPILKDSKKAITLAAAVEGTPRARELATELGGAAAGEEAFATAIAQMERASPELAALHERQTLRNMAVEAQVFSEGGRAFSEVDDLRRARGSVLRARGMEGFLGADLIDEEGRATSGLWTSIVQSIVSRFGLHRTEDGGLKTAIGAESITSVGERLITELRRNTEARQLENSRGVMGIPPDDNH